MKEKTLSRGNQNLIKQAISKTKSTNRNILCAEISRTIESKYTGKSFDYQVKRKKLETTGKILEAIDTYFYSYFSVEDIPEQKKLDN